MYEHIAQMIVAGIFFTFIMAVLLDIRDKVNKLKK